SAEQRRLTELRESAERDLAEIANAEQEIVRQQGHAAKEPELRATLERHDAEKRKQDEVTRLSDDLRRVQIERAEIGTMLVTDRRIAGAGDGSVRAALGLVSAFEVE